jgi:hypothetical protein
MINRKKTIFYRVKNQKNRQSVGEEGTAPCFSSFGGGAKAWYRDEGGTEREVEPRGPLAQLADEGRRCSQARKILQPFCEGSHDLESVLMSLNGRSHHGLEN